MSQPDCPALAARVAVTVLPAECTNCGTTGYDSRHAHRFSLARHDVAVAGNRGLSDANVTELRLNFKQVTSW